MWCDDHFKNIFGVLSEEKLIEKIVKLVKVALEMQKVFMHAEMHVRNWTEEVIGKEAGPYRTRRRRF